MSSSNMPKGWRSLAAAAVALGLVAVSGASAQDAKPSSNAPGIASLYPEAATSAHSVPVGGGTLEYQATAATLPLRAANGVVTAHIFHVAYVARPQARERPITFVFNGGPGAASAYLNLGAIGPRGVVFNEDGSLPPPPARLADNPDTWLAFTDLVFVDPVGTGYSRSADPEKAEDFWGVESDERSMAAFIRLYLKRNERMTSPVFLVGESYGALRAARLAQSLPDESGVGVNGVILVAPALELHLVHGHEPGRILPAALALPSMAAVELYSGGVVSREALAGRLESVTAYALGDYLVALAAGPEAAREESARVAEFTGLPAETVRNHFGKVPVSVFLKAHDSAAEGRLSRYDGLVSGPDTHPSRRSAGGADPVLDRITPILTSAFIDHVQGELAYETDITYRLLNRRVNRRWEYGSGPRRQGYAGAVEELQEARSLNPALEVLIASGYTDLVTPFSMPRFLVRQMPPLAGAAPIVIEDYIGGHMMYLRPETRRALAADAEALYLRALSATGG